MGMTRNSRRKNSWRWQGTVDGKRKEKSFTCNQKTAETIGSKLDELCFAHNYNDEIPNHVRNWVKKQDIKIQKKFAELGVWTVGDEASAPKRLLDFIKWHLEDATKKVEVESVKKMRNAEKLIGQFFTDNPFLNDITYNRCARFETYLTTEAHNIRTGGKGYSINHTRRTLGYLQGFLNAAVDAEIINKNPASKIKVSVGSNEIKWHYIYPEEFNTLMGVADADMRLRLVLLRFLGLRCTSEFHTLKWKHVDWKEKSITIIDTKNKRHEKRMFREVPIFKPVMNELKPAWEKGVNPDDYIIQYESNTEWRRKMLELIAAAGLEPWADLFTNFRRSAITDAAEEHPPQCIDKWFGNTEGIRKQHYLQVTARDHEKAVNAESWVSVPQNVPRKPSANAVRRGTRRNRYIQNTRKDGISEKKANSSEETRTPLWAVLDLNKTLKPSVF